MLWKGGMDQIGTQTVHQTYHFGGCIPMVMVICTSASFKDSFFGITIFMWPRAMYVLSGDGYRMVRGDSV